MYLAVLSLTAFLFVVMKNGLSFKRTESCLCCTSNMVIKMLVHDTFHDISSAALKRMVLLTCVPLQWFLLHHIIRRKYERSFTISYLMINDITNMQNIRVDVTRNRDTGEQMVHKK